MSHSRVKYRFLVNINEFRSFYKDAYKLLRDPVKTIPTLEAGAKAVVLERSDGLFFEKAREKERRMKVPDERLAGISSNSERICVGFEGNFGDSTVTPRTLCARHLSHMVCVEGIVTKANTVHPKLVRSVHYSEKSKQFEAREYNDFSDFSGDIKNRNSIMPTVDKDNNPLIQEYGLSVYKDSQVFTIQEMPEAAPLGQLPRSVDVYVDGDLVDETKPGDRVAVVGVYRADAGNQPGGTFGNFKTILVGNSIRKLRKSAFNVTPSVPDVANIEAFAANPDAFKILSRSLAPSIFGHKEVKESLALLLLGGREHVLKNGTHLRGDINILMVGDPSTAKSQLLRFVLNTAPIAVNTTGRGSSGVGLTAAVTTNTETGERQLEAGAMVLADRGVVCIDEFDKVSTHKPPFRVAFSSELMSLTNSTSLAHYFPDVRRGPRCNPRSDGAADRHNSKSRNTGLSQRALFRCRRG